MAVKLILLFYLEFHIQISKHFKSNWLNVEKFSKNGKKMLQKM